MKRFISGDNIYLREVRPSDVTSDYYNWLNDSEINKYLETRFIPQSIETISEFVHNKLGNKDELLFAIVNNNEDKHIGNIKIGPINWIHRRADISYFIGDKDSWGKGFAQEAIRLVCEHAFNVLNLNKIIAGAYKENIGSICALKKVGFEIEGEISDYAFSNGRVTSMVILGLSSKNHLNIDNK